MRTVVMDSPCETISRRTGRERTVRFNPADNGYPRLPRGMVYAHTCFNKLCSNKAVTNSENLLDLDNLGTGSAAHCKNGHPMAGDNVRTTKPCRTHGAQRVCRTCTRENMRRYRAEGRIK